MPDSRKYVRYECDIAVELIINGRSFTTRVLDISTGGAALKSVAVLINVGDTVRLTSRKHGSFSGKTQWKGTLRFGVEFDALTVRSKELAALISHLQTVSQ